MNLGPLKERSSMHQQRLFEFDLNESDNDENYEICVSSLNTILCIQCWKMYTS